MKNRDAAMAGFWILLGLAITIWSSAFPFGDRKAPGPGLLPLATGIVILLLGSILSFQALTGKDSQERCRPFFPDKAALTRVTLSLGGMIVSGVLFMRLGFILTVFFLILFLMRSIEPQKWRVSVLYAVVSALSSYIVFKVFLKTPLPEGLLGF